MKKAAKEPRRESMEMVGRDAEVLVVGMCDSLGNRLQFIKVNHNMMGPLSPHECDLLLRLLDAEYVRALRDLKSPGASNA